MEAEKARVLLAMSDVSARDRMEEELSFCRLVRSVPDAEGVYKALCAEHFDALVTDLSIRGADAMLLRERICALPVVSSPAMLVLFPEGLAQYTESLYNDKVAAVIHKPAGERALRAALSSLRPSDRLIPDWASDERIRRRLDELSVRMDFLGYRYLLRAVSLTARSEKYPGELGKAIYPEVARLYGTRAQLVERAVRHAIEQAWTHGDPGPQYRIFEGAIDESKGKPTNAEFIARVVDTLRMEA